MEANILSTRIGLILDIAGASLIALDLIGKDQLNSLEISVKSKLESWKIIPKNLKSLVNQIQNNLKNPKSLKFYTTILLIPIALKISISLIKPSVSVISKQIGTYLNKFPPTIINVLFIFVVVAISIPSIIIAVLLTWVLVYLFYFLINVILWLLSMPFRMAFSLEKFGFSNPLRVAGFIVLIFGFVFQFLGTF